MKGIKRKLTFSYALVSIVTIGIFQMMFCIGIVRYYHGNITQTLANRAAVSSEFYNTYMKYEEIEDKAKYMMENFSMDEYFEMQIVDKSGHVIESSSGFYSSEYVETDDFTGAVSNAQTKHWTGYNKGTNEKIIAVSAPLYYANEVTGAVRYVTSIEDADRVIRGIFVRVAMVGIVAFAVALFVSGVLGKSIIDPIKRLRGISEKMAAGDFSVRADIKNDDEIGELAAALNYMADETVKSNNVKDEFISSISHEIRTPLTAIKGWSETILSCDMDDEGETREGLQIISSETERLIKLVEELLDFSRLCSKKMKINIKVQNIAAILENTVKQFRSKAHSKGIGIGCSCDQNEIYAACDSDRIRQVIINLLENAIKFANSNVAVTAGIEEGMAFICVEDDGCGIAPADIERVKEKFYKVDPGMPGSGIGLSVSDEIARLHNGRLQIEKGRLSGAVVKLLIPAIDVNKCADFANQNGLV